MGDTKLSPAQQAVLDAAIDWFKVKDSPVLTIGGYAGTGKTTLIGFLRKLLKKEFPKLKVAFCSYTGKATRVMEEKLKETKSTYRADNISTIHSLIYRAITDDDGEVLRWDRRGGDDFDYGLIIVDEASMVNSEIWQDLLTYGIPVLAVGDHGQLPPIGGNFNLMESPELRLEEIYRQEEGNPIIRLSSLARSEGSIPFGIFGPRVRKLRRADPDTQEFLGDLFMRDDDTLVLTGYNHTRVKLNQAIRNIREFESEHPTRGDKVICLRNNHKSRIYNGMVGEINSISFKEEKGGEYYEAELYMDGRDDLLKVQMSVEQFGAKSTLKDERRKGIDLFDFGYALTVHKAQGSQAKTVVLFEERFSKMSDEEWRRWLYTAVTRAREELYIVS